MVKHRQYTYFYILSRATLNETFTAKYDGVLPRTLRACLHGGGGPQVGEVTRLGEVKK